MPRTTSPAPKAVEEDPRLSVEHMAASLYAERIAEDAKRGQAAIYTANPDARALYFKGVHDSIGCIEEWVKMGLPKNTLGMFLEALLAQTEDAATKPAH